MHPDADAFLDAIFEHPEDDTPRLVYADWLQEHGQENYAQFIRLQCAAAQEKLWSDAANRLWVEIGRVWNRLDEEWWPATRDVWSEGWGGYSLDAVHFQRGFQVKPDFLTTSQLVRYGHSCWPWLPLPFTTLDIDGSEAELFAWPRVQRIRHLYLCGSDVPDYAMACVRSPEVHQLGNPRPQRLLA
ncbi:MAG: TIGR02996 domain-containing protein [Gemmataceae bacterium]|nr:TIGR02996 domain-containing protein [Gemmataceae bacterium]